LSDDDGLACHMNAPSGQEMHAQQGRRSGRVELERLAGTGQLGAELQRLKDGAAASGRREKDERKPKVVSDPGAGRCLPPD